MEFKRLHFVRAYKFNKMESLLLRPFVNEDKSQLSELYSQEWETNITEEILSKFFLNDNYLFVAEENYKIIASANLHLQYKLIHYGGVMGYIEDVIVSNEHRGRGIGKKIVSRLLEEAKNKKCYKVALLCDKGLEKFYLGSKLKTQEKFAMEKVFKENFTY